MALSDITQACTASYQGGLAEIYITDACNITAATADASSNAFTAITTTADWFKFEGARNTMSLVFTGSESGAYECVLTCGFEGMEKTTLFKLEEAVALGKLAVIAVTTNLAGTNPRAFIIGYDKKIGNSAYAKAKIDGKIESDLFEGLNDTTVTFTSKQATTPFEVVTTIDYNSTTVTLGS